MKLELKKEHIDFKSVKHNAEEHGFNAIVAFPNNMGNLSDSQTFGRLAQVRKKRGAFGTDELFVLTQDDDLLVLTNMTLFTIKEEYLEKFEKHTPKATKGLTYTICGEQPETGFVIPFDESTQTNNDCAGFMVTVSEEVS